MSGYLHLSPETATSLAPASSETALYPLSPSPLAQKPPSGILANLATLHRQVELSIAYGGSARYAKLLAL